MLESTSNLYAEYQSPDWWEHLGRTPESGDRSIWITRSTLRNRLISAAHGMARRTARTISALRSKALSAIVMSTEFLGDLMSGHLTSQGLVLVLC